MKPESTVVIGIATAGRREQMKLTLAQLAGQQRLPSRIVVCPAAIDDFDEANVPLVGCPVDVIRGPRGLTAQRNTILAACADTDVLIFLDDDFYPATDYVEQVMALFAAHPDIVVATNHPERDGATGPGIAHAEAVALIESLRLVPNGAACIEDTYGGYGCNMSVRMAQVREHGVQFDVNLPQYGWLEDIDFSRLMAPHGRIAECSSLRGVHLATKRGRISGLRFGYSQIANPLYLFDKGSISLGYAWRHIAKNVAKNMLRFAWPEPWVDRRGRLRGNLIAVGDWLRGRLDPRRVEQLGTCILTPLPESPVTQPMAASLSPAATTTALIDAPARQRLLIDDSLSLINRTGAHFIAKDLVEHFRDRALVRRWRLFGADLPQGLVRKLLARTMLGEMHCLGSRERWRWPERGQALRLFLDPLFVLRAELDEDDVVLCHDIGPLTHTDLYLPQTVRWYEAAYARIRVHCPGLVFVSQTSQTAFASRFGRDFRFLRNIPLYVRSETDDGPQESVPGIKPPFFLSVGALERRKNHGATLSAFERSGLANAGVTLVLCGSRGDATAEIEQQVARTHGVVLPGYVSDAQLRWLYREALAFVLPSLLEGFGMPALEAAKHGLIPIISGDSALNEAIGGLGLPINAHAPDEIAQAMHRVHQLAPDERAAWQQRLREHARGATRTHYLQQWDQLINAELQRKLI